MPFLTNMFCLLILITVISPALTKVYMMNAPNVTITYPIMAQKYNHYSLEKWTFDYKTILNFTVVVTKMSIEKSNGCKADFLRIIDDRFYNRNRILCGQRSSNITVYNGLTYHIDILFNSDGSWNDSGFSLQVTGYPVNNSNLCELMHYINYFLITSSIMTYRDRYPASLDCSWEISAPTGKAISLSFTRFDIEYSGPDCPYDRVEVWNSFDNNPQGQLLGRFCGKHYPWIFNTNSNSIYIRFITDAADNSNGFQLRYSRTEISQPDQIIYKLTASPTIDTIALPLIDATPVLTWIIRTHPGFRIAIYFHDNETENALKMYDGPSSDYKGLTDNFALSAAGGKTVDSNGFYLTVNVNLPLNISTNLSYMSVNHMTFRSTGLTFSGEFDFYQTVKIRYVYHVLYFAYIVPPNKHPRCHVKPGAAVIRQGPNTDDCALTGIAFYHGTVSFDNLIGPFCNINKDYLNNILDKMVGSTSVTYVVMYDYSNKRKPTLYQHHVVCSAEKCRGFQIAENMFHTTRSVRSNNFTLYAYTKHEEKYLKIFYNESNDDCIVIHLLPYKKHSTGLTILLTGKFRYRICRQWGFQKVAAMISSLNGSKYITSENCTNYPISTDQTTELHESINTLYGWTKEFTVLELGPVSDNLCPEVLCRPYQNTVTTLSCGTLTGVSRGCRLILTSPESSYRDSIWVVRIGNLWRDTTYRNRDGMMVISEIHMDNRSNVMTKISCFKIGTIRAFTYKSLPEVQLEIYTVHLRFLSMRFSQEKRYHFENRQRRNEPTCSDYNNTSYLFNIHEHGTSWEAANLECKERGGYLVSINSQDELDFLKTCLEGPWESTFYGNNRGLIYIGLADPSQEGSYRWEDGSPLTLSDWYYPFAVFDNVLPELPKPPIDVDKIQPVVDLSQRCVAMVPGNPRFSTNWRKVPCDFFTVLSNVYSICEIKTVRPYKPVPRNHAKLPVSRSHCPQTYIFIFGHCIRLLTRETPLIIGTSRVQAQRMCQESGSEVADAGILPRQTLRKLLISIGFKESDGDIWVKHPSAILGCISLSILSQDTLYEQWLSSKSSTCQPSDGHASHVICEITPIQLQNRCHSHHFRCADGTCLNLDRVCDHHPDCSSAEDESNCVLQISTFRCGSGETISISRYCDFYVDCDDTSDENRCVHVNCSESQFTCSNGQCIEIELHCDNKFDCADKSDENFCHWEIECKHLKCPIVGCVPFSKVEDLKPDCPDTTEADEMIIKADHKRFNFYIKDKYGNYVQSYNYDAKCPERVDYQRCHSDHMKCFPRDKTCLYDHNLYNQLLYCSNGAHLRYCEHFECPDHFKCPASYCIPQHKVCDGVQDCVEGEDEKHCDNRSCPNQLRCGRSNQCVSFQYVCDAQVHCKSGRDDEIACNLELSDCPANCSCIGLAIICRRHAFQSIPLIDNAPNIKLLDFSHNNLNGTSLTFQGFGTLAHLHLNNNSISSLNGGVFVLLPNLLLLDLSDNMLSVVEPETFLGLENLKTLKLHGNPIHQILPGSFIGLSALQELNLSSMYIEVVSNETFLGLCGITNLNLSNNLISFVHQEAVSSLPHLRVLSLTQNYLDETQAGFVRDLRIQTLHTDSYIFCCNVGSKVTECSPAVNSYTSCSDLLPNEFLQGIVWAFAVLALVGNGGVICWRVFIEKVHNIPSIFILNLSLADMLMGIYLFSLSITNIRYKGIYTLNDKIWRHSNLCRLIGVIATVSCEMSMFTLVCIAIDRTRRLAYPFSSYQFNKKSASLTMILGWVFALVTGVIPFSMPSYFGDYYSRNAVCLPFNFADPLGRGWEFSFFVFVGLNAFGLSLVVIMYGLTYNLVRKTQNTAGREDRIDLEVARKLTIIIVTDVICVIPLTMTNLLSVLGEPINRDMASVLTTVILPINSALNPYLFSFSAIQSYKKKKFVRKSSSVYN